MSLTSYRAAPPRERFIGVGMMEAHAGRRCMACECFVVSFWDLRLEDLAVTDSPAS